MSAALVSCALILCALGAQAAPMAQISSGHSYNIPKGDPFVVDLATQAARKIQDRDDDGRQVLFLYVEQAEANIEEGVRTYEIRFVAGKTNCQLGEKCDEWNVETKALYLATVSVPEQSATDYEINVVPLQELGWGGEDASGFGCRLMHCGLE